MEISESSKMYDTDLSLFPDLEKYKNQLAVLGSLTPENTQAEALYDRFFDLAVILSQMTVKHTAQNFNEQLFFRVRLNVDPTTEDINAIQTYSYPPGFVCRENGRANLKGKSVFYCSNNPTCALLESKPKAGDIAHISLWKGRANREMKFAVCLPLEIKTEEQFQIIADQAWKMALEHYTQEARDKWEHFMELNKFISSKFVTETAPYFLTSWFADQILFTKEKYRDYILYATVESNNDYCNMAFHPNVVNQFLMLEKVIRAKILKVAGGGVKFSLGKVGEINLTNIEWRAVTNAEDKLFSDYGFRSSEISAG